jgi:S-formylglutathione hydrolase FrmB
MKRGNLRLLSAVAMFILLSGPLSRAAFLYVVNPHQAIVGFSIGSDGALTPVPGSPFAVDAQAIAVDPTGKFAYVGSLTALPKLLPPWPWTRWQSSFTWQTLITGMLWTLLLMRATAR